MEARRFSVRLRFITLQGGNLARSYSFYHELLGLVKTGEKLGEFIQLGAGGVDLCIDLADSGDHPLLIFSVDDLDALCDRLRQASIAIDGPKAGCNGRYIMVRDHDNNLMVFEEKP